MSETPGDITTVRTGGWKILDWAVFGVCILLIPFGALFLDALAIGGFPGGIRAAFVASTILIALVFLAEQSIASLRRIEISADGIRFGYLFHSEFGKWSELRPGPLPPGRDAWYLIRYRGGNPATPRAHRLTHEQARAVLISKYCPPWPLPATVTALITSRSSSV